MALPKIWFGFIVVPLGAQSGTRTKQKNKCVIVFLLNEKQLTCCFVGRDVLRSGLHAVPAHA